MSKREENEQQRVSRDSRIQEKECAEKKIKNKKLTELFLRRIVIHILRWMYALSIA